MNDMNDMQKLKDKEEQILTLYIVEACIKYASENGKDFEEVLTEDVFANQASEIFEEMICTTIEKLYKNGYIAGNVELEYEYEMDPKTFEEKKLDSINTAMCTFENIEITKKGKAYMLADNMKNLGKEFIGKTKPMIQMIASTALQASVELALTTAVNGLGLL